MEKEALKDSITRLVPAATFEEGGEWITFHVDAPSWPAVARIMRNEETLLCDYLFCVTCIDWKTHLIMVYHLTSTRYRHTVVIKSKLDREKPEIHTVSDIWRTAEFHEREAYEMFGVQFQNHPDLRLLILPDGWEGRNPMRKDFEDPVNMIRL